MAVATDVAVVAPAFDRGIASVAASILVEDFRPAVAAAVAAAVDVRAAGAARHHPLGLAGLQWSM